MLGASRNSMAGLEEFLASLYQDSSAMSDFSAAGNGCLDVADVLDDNATLRSSLADAARSGSAKRELGNRLFKDRVSPMAHLVLDRIFTSQWGEPRDLVDAVEDAGRTLLLMNAEAEGRIEAVEEEVFRFGRAIDANPPLQMVLTDPANSAAVKAAVVHAVLAGRSAEETPILLAHLVGHLRGRRVQDAVVALSRLAAARHGRVVAEIRSTIRLTPRQQGRLAAALAALHGRPVELNEIIDEDVIGGIEVRVGDDVIDGTVAGKLEQARRLMRQA